MYTVAPLDYETHSNHTLVVMSARTSDIYYVQVEVSEERGVAGPRRQDLNIQ